MNKTLRVLNVEDSERDAALLTRHLSRAGYALNLERVETPERMRAALEAQEWDLILCDYSMPHFNSFSALLLLQETELDLPFIIISGTVGEAVAVEAMRAGAHDYLMKDNLVRLVPTIERELHEAENRRARRWAERALKDSEAELRALFEAMTDVILVFDAQGRHLKMAPTRSASIYKPAGERIGKMLHEVFPQETADLFLDYVHRALDEGRTQRLEYTLSINGKETWFEGTVSPMTPDSVIWIAHDITERKHAEKQLRLQSTALQSAANAIVITDNEGKISWVNLAFTTLTGYTLEDVSGQGTNILKSGMHETAFYKTLWDTILSGQVWHGEITNLRKDGAIYVEEETITPVLNETGEITNFIAIKQDITERKGAEEQKAQLTAQIESQRRRLNNIVASVPGVVWEAWGEPDAATQQTNFVSDYVETMLGYSVDEWLSTPNFGLSVVHPDDRERMARAASADFAGGKSSNTREFRWVAKDGRVLWVQSNSALVTDDQDRPVGLRGVTIDVTERKRAEEALRDSEERYRLLFASNPFPMWVYDVGTLSFLEVNDAAVHRYGYSRQEFLSMTIKDIRPAEDIPALLANVASPGSGRLDEAGVWRHRKKDGQIIDVEITSHELIFAGRHAHLVLALDVTERKRAEKAVKQAEEKYRSIFENAVEGIFQSTTDGRFISVNPSMARILGYESPEELMTHRTDIGTQHYVDANSRAELERLLAEHGVVVGHECEVYRKDRSKIWTIENVRAIRDEAGAVLYYEGSIEDIAERKTLEEQLRQSQKLEAIGMLAGGIAHDFNNLLTVITGYSELTLLGLREEDPIHRNIGEVKKAAERAAGLTRQLLAFSRKQVLQPKVLDLNAVVSELEKLLGRLIGEDVGLRTVLESDLGSVKADPGQIEQIIMNLAVNARDAMPQGGKLTIETRNVYRDAGYAKSHIAVIPGSYVMLAVSDTGIGMDQQTLARIFEPFFTTKEMGKGTGLGLSTVYGIVKQSGGNIWVYSEIGRGTTFKVYLPRVDEGAQEYKHGAETERPIQGVETVLVAEDEGMVRKLACQVLEMYGYHVLEAANGGAALLVCERDNEPIHLLITDVIMPEMSGRDLADRLAQNTA